MHDCPDANQASRVQLRPKLEVADIVRHYGVELSNNRKLSFEQQKVLNAIASCRTAALGGYLDVCDHCGHKRPAYKSCRNRHCPKCQWIGSQKWLEKRQQRVLKVHHFHVVFTLPSELRSLVMVNKTELFSVLFKSASSALLKLGRDERRLGAQLGITAVLHSWSRDMSFHPHVHCVVSGGGIRDDGRWISTNIGFLFPVNVLSVLFRGIFLDSLKRLQKDGQLIFTGRCEKLKDKGNFYRFLDKLYTKKFNVYCKDPFDGIKGVFAYLGRYTHKTAISNGRLISFDDREVVFFTRCKKTASLSPLSFLSRLLSHVLPKGFVRIRHYGLYAAGNVNTKLHLAKAVLQEQKPTDRPESQHDENEPLNDIEEPDYARRYRLATGIDLTRCPVCHIGRMRRYDSMNTYYPAANRAPPKVL